MATLYPVCPILMVDDEPAWLRSMTIMLERLGGINNLVTCDDSLQVMELLSRRQYELVLLDYSMPNLTGVELLEQIAGEYPELPVVILTGHNQVETAVDCLKRGAVDYFVKTMEDRRLVAGVQRIIRMQEIARENRKLREGIIAGRQLEHPDAFAGIITQSNSIQSLFHYIEAIAPSPQPVLITGESGVGKELFARAVHQVSRPGGPWVPVNVAGLDENIFADTMFGHARGAFTDADRERPGMLEQARGGVLFLDEIGSLDINSQAKLLRVLQDGEYYPLGSDRPRRLQARVVAATNQNLAELQLQGEFRKDLYFRLRTHHLHIPALRERGDDLLLLADHFLADAARELGKVKPTPPRELARLLASYDFPGNVRELRAMAYDAVATHAGRVLSLEAFRRAMGLTASNGHGNGATVGEKLIFGEQLPTLAEAGRALVDEAMARAGGNQGVAAQMLGISRPALNKRLKKMEDG
ncbi:MAG: sigma-54-dependent Fis family transcriptional regulator [Deltaproteobacteria bacterium]|nr:MAG: sigma-54-dependent Fis family transcriptional regulator [Deltaproteobacteria bacterium]